MSDIVFQTLLRDYRLNPTDEASRKLAAWVVRSNSKPVATHAVLGDESKGQNWSNHLIPYQEGDSVETLLARRYNPDNLDAWREDEGEWAEEQISWVKVIYLLDAGAADILEKMWSVMRFGMDSSTSNAHYYMQELAALLCFDKIEVS